MSVDNIYCPTLVANCFVLKRDGIRMNLKTNEAMTTIKDPVHGYIEFPKSLVRNFIDTDLFQRLQEVSQTGMKVLYPNATHNRFCHSLGVYHLGKKSFSYFRTNVKTQFYQVYKNIAEDCKFEEKNEIDVIWDKWELLFELSCLLHDCGHSPFSHSLEEVYDFSQADIFSGITAGDSSTYYSCEYLTQVFGKDSAFSKGLIRNNKPYGAPHERMSACMMISQYGRSILNILVNSFCAPANTTHGKMCFCEAQKADYQQCNKILEQCDLDDGKAVNKAIKGHCFIQDLEFMVRCIIGYPYDIEDCDLPQKRITNQLKNCIIKLLNSRLDVDNLDYTVRDSAISGYSSATVDIERLLRSRTITVGNVLNQRHVREKELDDEFRLTQLVYKSDDGKFDAYLSGPLRYECTTLDGFCQVSIDGIERPNLKYCTLEENQKIHICSNGTEFKIKPRRGQAFANVHIVGTVSGMLSGQVFGEIKKDDCVLTWLDEELPVCIESAFHKSALSVLQGAYDANNFESLWIYSHHKTTYYNSFLVFCLLDTYCGILYERDQEKLKEVLCAMAPVSNCPIVTSETHCNNDTVSKALELLGSKNSAVQCSGGFAWSVDDVSKMTETLKKGSWNPEKLGLAYDILCAAAVARFSGVKCSKNGSDSQNKLEEDEKKILAAYDKLKCLFEELSKENCDITTTSDDIKWVQQIRHFESLSGDVIKVMFNVIGMTKTATYDGKTFYRSSDYDLLSRYKELARELKQKEKQKLTAREKRFQEIHLQLESRNYCRSMWKSHAEFAYYVQRYSKEELNLLNLLLTKAAARNSPRADNGEMLPSSPYVFLSDYHCQELEDLWQYLKENFHNDQDELETLIWVPQRIKHKSYELRNTYITWKKRTVSLADLNFHQGADNKISFFYLYYRYGHYNGNHSEFVSVDIEPEKMLTCLINYTKTTLQGFNKENAI